MCALVIQVLSSSCSVCLKLYSVAAVLCGFEYMILGGGMRLMGYGSRCVLLLKM